MGQIVISDLDDKVIQELERHALALHMTLDESLRKILIETAGQSLEVEPSPSDNLTNDLESSVDKELEPNGTLLARLVRQYASTGMAEKFGNPVEWQRGERTDRPLKGREI